MITPGTYCVCNAGDHNNHGGVKGQHLAKDEAVVIGTLDMVTDVDLGPNKLPMILSSDKKTLSMVMDYPHTRTAGGSNNVQHLVQITPARIDPTQTPGCDATKNTLKIAFCFKADGSDEWKCAPPDADFGDTHVQN